MYNADGRLNMEGARVLFRRKETNRQYINDPSTLNDNVDNGGRMSVRLQDNQWNSRGERNKLRCLVTRKNGAPIAKLEVTALKIAEERQAVYNNAFALTIYWEQDNTDAVQDTAHFQTILSTLNLPQAELAMLSSNDPTPSWTLQPKFTSLLAQRKGS
ncbi:hypothetical protein N7486_000264 [Penicillium sp. IBT 16267x]|nr:hypothetical protein N7486_000264 [Penicillium sp. IBT 16267x]